MSWRGRGVRLAKRPSPLLPIAVQRSQLASMSPSDISFPQKTTISSRSKTICAITAVKPIRIRTASTVRGARSMPRKLDSEVLVLSMELELDWESSEVKLDERGGKL